MNPGTDFRIIVIDDNPAIHQDFIKILKTDTSSELDKLDYEIFGDKDKTLELLLPKFQIDVSSQGEEGIQRIKDAMAENNPYSLAFVDIRMPPGWDGIKTIKHIWELDKDIQVVICTAYSDYSWGETISHLGQTDNLLVLKKPFDNIAVRQLACALTKKWQLIQDARKYTMNLKQQVADRTHSLQKSLSLVKATLESSSDGILVVNEQGSIVDYNIKFTTMWKIPESMIKNTVNVLEFISGQIENPDEFFTNTKMLCNVSSSIKIDIVKLKNGKIYEYYSQPQKINEKVVGHVWEFRDVTKRAKLEEKLQHQATHDVLTDLPNRVMLLDRIHQEIKIADQKQTNFALLFLDLDRFKLVNDSLSHAIGDQLLQSAAIRLEKALTNEDMLARLGGDEFVIILTHVTNNVVIATKANNILNIFQQPFNLDNRELIVTASIGISVYPKDGNSGDILLRNADSAMYYAKEQKGNNYQFYTSDMNTKSLEKLEKETQLRKAVINDEFFLCYQPQFDLANQTIIAAEALIRWQHPEKGVLLPLDFIPLAEETGLIVQIGEWVLRAACAQCKAWQNSGLPPMRVAVNVTAQQFMHQNLIETIQFILQETDLDPKYLEIELTENVIISNQKIIDAVYDLKKIGVSIAIDDFGTGYSSLSYLKKIPLDRLKIDSSFIQHIQTVGDDEVIIRAVIAMAKNLDLEVLAEGVETQLQLDFLKKHECSDVQGFYFSKPLTTDEMEKLLGTPASETLIKT